MDGARSSLPKSRRFAAVPARIDCPCSCMDLHRLPEPADPKLRLEFSYVLKVLVDLGGADDA